MIALVTFDAASSTMPAPLPGRRVLGRVPVASRFARRHRLFGFSLAVSDNGGGAVTTQLDVLSDEDDVTGGGGEMSPDAKSVAPVTLRLRAERDGASDGRVYLIRVRATDSSSNTAVSCVTVVVPKSMSAADLASVNAQAGAAHAGCSAPFVVGDGPKVGPKQ